MRIVALSWILLACGPSGTNPPDAAPDDAGVDTAPDTGLPPPQAPQVESLGGAVVAAPNVVPVFWANDADQAKLEAFLGAVAGSSYWTQATSEYNVGPLTLAPSVVVTDTPPTAMDDGAIGPWLATKIGVDPAWPAPSANNIYVLYYPSTTKVTYAGGGQSCVTFLGYHNHADANLYVVKPRCTVTRLGFDSFDWMTKGTSHEIAEVATDPLWDTTPAFDAVDDDHAAWAAMLGPEVGDMCDPQPQSIQRLVGPYAVERTWSNASAKAGHDPCVPALSTPYFNVAPMFDSKVTMPSPRGSGQIHTLGVSVHVGQSVTVPVQFFADGPMADWTVIAKGDNLTFSWDSPQGNQGDVRQLTITRTATSTNGGSVLTLQSSSGSLQNVWYSFVSN